MLDFPYEARAISPSAAPSRIDRVSPLVRRLTAPNAGPFTYTGTCSYIVGNGDVAIVDPGPADPRHVEAMLAAIGGERLLYILVTHTHRDHSPAAAALKAATGAAIAGCAPYAPPPDITVTGPGLDASHDKAYAPDAILKEGDCLDIGGATVGVLETPGHTANHLCFALAKVRSFFTGHRVIGRSAPFVPPPDGSMTDYMASIERLRLRDDAIYWPAHGEPVKEPARYLRALVHHRRVREAAILQRLEDGDETIAEMVARIYESIDKRLHGAAALNVFAHLEDLVARGRVASDGPPTLSARYRKAG
jgi:glyoxylase-like metal-dependent hydrolase (beta-lactamase superfamily II)